MITQRRFELGAIAIFAVICLVLSSWTFVKANPSYFTRANGILCGSLTATTSPTFMTAGTATTTVTFDSGCATSNSQDSSVLSMQLTASSTNTKLAVNFEYSQDNIDWYQSNLSAQATTTPVQDISTAQSYLWSFASTTPGLGAPAGTRQMKTIVVPTPTRYVRAVFTIPSGSTNGAIWAEFDAKRQAGV